MAKEETISWPKDDSETGIPVVPAEWLGIADALAQANDAFMRAWSRKSTSSEYGIPCIGCGFPCESDQIIFAVDQDFTRFSKYFTEYENFPIKTPTAHAVCALTMYRGRFQMLKRMLYEGADIEEMKLWLESWPFSPDEIRTNDSNKQQE